MEEQFNKRKGAKSSIQYWNKSEWFPGIIKRKFENINYELEIENNPEFRTDRLHTNQLRPYYSESQNVLIMFCMIISI